MLRATAWTVGLFGAGTALCRVFPVPWLEPVVLLALGIAFLFVSAHLGTRRRRTVALPLPRTRAIEQERVPSGTAPAAAPVRVEP